MDMETIDYRTAVRRHLTGKRGRHLRAEGQYTQTEIAQRAGLPRSTLTSFLAGGQCYIGNVEKMLNALGYSLVAVPMHSVAKAGGTAQT